MVDPPFRLKDSESLERSEVVGNAAMNRSRDIVGGNSYARDLGFQCLAFLLERLAARESVAWLDLCCGSGRAVIQAARSLQRIRPGRYEIVGIDLIPMFEPIPDDVSGVRLIEGSITQWRPDRAFDLITCVHGLHYVGDKLGALCRAAGWLKSDGVLLAHLDVANLRFQSGVARHSWRTVLRRAGFTYSAGRHLVRLEGFREVTLPYRFLGADDSAGPNCTGQPAVDSWYAAPPD